MAKIPRELEPRRAFWLEHARRSEQSGQSVGAYAAAHGLAPRALYRWRGLACREGLLVQAPADAMAEQFARVELPPRAAASVLRIGLPNGCTVELSGALDSTLLATVLRESAAL